MQWMANFNISRQLAAVLIIAICTVSAPTSAQVIPPHWDNSIGQPGMEGKGVLALTVYNGDMVAGGFFSSAGGIPGTNALARWNGASWQSFPSSPGGVLAMEVYAGDLIAGGHLYSAPGDCYGIANWNGATWKPLGSGVGLPEYDGCPSVYAFAIYKGDLIAGGLFTTAGGIAASNVARWDGASWQALGEGISGPNPGFGLPWVQAMTVYNGELIVGGRFKQAGGIPVKGIARWNGSAWQSLGDGLGFYPCQCCPGENVDCSSINALTVFNGDLIAAGQFTSIDGTAANHIARWNGSSWQSLGTGVMGSFPIIETLHVFDDHLIAGGSFNTAGMMAANNIAKWNGSTWQVLGSGISSQIPLNYSQVSALTVYEGALVVGGGFTTAGGASANHIAVWKEGSSNQPEYEVLDIPPDVKNVVFITHGWNTTPDVWTNFWEKLEQDVKNEINALPDSHEWHVIAHQWDSCGFWGQWSNPLMACALNNATEFGPPIGKALAAAQLDHIHFIAHSAGSMLISKAAQEIRTIQGWIPPAPVIHSTFLDPYTGLSATPNNAFYGQHSNSSENYISRDSLNPWTWRPLSNAHNIDVTRIDPDCGFFCAPHMQCVPMSTHHWPYLFYRHTTTGLTPSGSFNCGGWCPDPFGWPLGMAAACLSDGGCSSWTVPGQHSKFPHNNPPFPLTCDEGGGAGDPEFPSAVTRFDDPLNFSEVQVSTSPGGVEISEDGFAISVAPGDGWGTDQSAVWVDVLVDLPDTVNFVMFEAAFTSPRAAEGLFSVYAGNLAMSSDERFTGSGWHQFYFDLPFEVGPGLAHFGFRLDAFGVGTSSVEVTNVQTGWGGAEAMGFALQSPADGAMLQNHGFVFEWEESPFAYWYELRIAHDPEMMDVVIEAIGLTSTTYAVLAGVLQDNTTYYWGVVARNPASETISSPGAAELTVLKVGDLTGSGAVGVADLLILLSQWGPCAECEECPADLDGDCGVGVGDLLILLANWG